MSFSREHRLIYGRLRETADRRRQERLAQQAPMPNQQTPLLTPADRLTEITALRRDARMNPQSDGKANLKTDIAAVNDRTQPTSPVSPPGPVLPPTVTPQPAPVPPAPSPVAPQPTPAPAGQEGSQDTAKPAEEAAGAQGDGTQTPVAPTTEQLASQTGLAGYVSTLPPELQGFGQSLIQQQQAYQQAEQANAAQYQGSTQIAGAAFQQEQGLLNSIAQNYETSKVQMQGVLDKVKGDQERTIAEQQKAAEQRLEWDTFKSERKLKEVQRKQIDGMVATLALRGGFGSSQGLQEINSANMDFENAIMDLQIEAGIQKTEIAAKFTGIYADVQSNYAQQTIGNIKEFNGALERIGYQALSSVQARAKAENEALTTFLGNQANLRLNAAKDLTAGIADIQDVIKQEKQFKAQQEAIDNDREWRKFVFEEDQQFRQQQFEENQRQFGIGVQVDMMQMEDRAEEKEMARDDRLIAKRNDNIGKLKSMVEKDPNYKKFSEVEPMYENLKASWTAAQNVDNYVASDQVMITMFNKILDSESVVREAEYDRTGADTPLHNRIKGLASKVAKGGTAMSLDDRKAIMDMADLMMEGYKKRMDGVAQKFAPTLGKYNQGLSDEYQIDFEDIGLPPVHNQDDIDIIEGASAGAGFGDGDSPWGQGGGESPAISYLQMGRVTQGFTTPVSSIAKGGLYSESTVKAWGGKHAGLDVAVPQGTKLPAPVSGTVVEAGFQDGWGGTVVIKDANGALHRTSHLSEVAVKPGDKVSRGKIFAVSGGKRGTKGAGNSTGAHVDYRIKVNGSYVDPTKYSLNS